MLIRPCHAAATQHAEFGLVEDEHLMFDQSLVEELETDTNGLFGDHAATMVHVVWQHDLRVITQFMKGSMDAHGGPGPQS